MLCCNAAERTFAKTKENHLKKLDKLSRKRTIDLRPEWLDRWVINRTNRTLTEPEKEVLRLGLNFVPSPSKIPVRDFAAAVETATSTLGDEIADDLRMRICGILKKARMPSPNLPRE